MASTLYPSLRKLLLPTALSIGFAMITAVKILWLIHAGSAPNEIVNFTARCTENGAVIEVTPSNTSLKSVVMTAEVVQEGISQGGAFVTFTRGVSLNGEISYNAPVPKGFEKRLRLLIEGESIVISGKCKGSPPQGRLI